MKACFMGLGYIGLPTAIIAAKHGINITGVDINQNVVEQTNKGHLHIVEPGIEDMLKEVVANGNLHAQTKPEESDAFFIVVPTPFRGGNHEPDISYVESATRMVLPYLREGNLFVIESTSPVGTTDKMKKIIFEERPELTGKIYIVKGSLNKTFVRNNIAPNPYDLYAIYDFLLPKFIFVTIINMPLRKIRETCYDRYISTRLDPFFTMIISTGSWCIHFWWKIIS
jgi:UDP-glucose 6-dehydrogenase